MLPSEVPRLATDSWWECFLVFGNFLLKTSFLGWISVPTSSVSLFIFYILSYLLSKTMGCLSGCLMSSASIQKLFCGICSAFKCSFNEFVGEKVVSPSYSSAISKFLFYSDPYWLTQILHRWSLLDAIPILRFLNWLLRTGLWAPCRLGVQKPVLRNQFICYS